VQVDSINTRVESANIQSLKLHYHKLLLTFAFNFNLRRYSWVCAAVIGFFNCDPPSGETGYEVAPGRGVIENEHSIAVESPPPPPCVCMSGRSFRTCTRPTLNLLLLLYASI